MHYSFRQHIRTMKLATTLIAACFAAQVIDAKKLGPDDLASRRRRAVVVAEKTKDDTDRIPTTHRELNRKNRNKRTATTKTTKSTGGSMTSKGSKGSKGGGMSADLVAYIAPYPMGGMAGGNAAGTETGMVEISIGYGRDMTIKLDIQGVAADCSATMMYPDANACGIHIHEGTTCNSADFVGGHFWSPAKFSSDPWETVQYHSTASGRSSFEITLDGGNGYGTDINHGHAFIIHDTTGKRIGCGLLEMA